MSSGKYFGFCCCCVTLYFQTDINRNKKKKEKQTCIRSIKTTTIINIHNTADNTDFYQNENKNDKISIYL